MRVRILVSALFLIAGSSELLAQNRQLFPSQQFRLGERIIRIAEPGELADSVNVWGDIGSAGRYVVPKGTTLPKIISYSLGPRTLRDGQTELDWSKMRVEVNIQKFDSDKGVQTIEKFRYRFEKPFPEGMSEFIVKNNQTVTLRVKRKPSFRDYVGVVAPVLTAITTTFLIYDRIRNQ